MKKLIRSKKGVNDVSILAGILALFLITATIIPFINEEFSTGYSEFNIDGTVDKVNQEGQDVSTINAFQVLSTVGKLAFWDFSGGLNLAWPLQAFFSVLSILFIVIISRNIWIGGGA